MDSLTRIRAFIDVVEAEGFSAAARKAGRSKALLSKYVRELEDELGALLLNRTTRQFSLTETGRTYFRSASEILRQIDDLAEQVRESASHVKGNVRVTAPRTFADAAIGQSLIDFSLAYPDITLEVVLDDRMVDLVDEGFDLGIRITRLQDSGMIARKLSPFAILPVASPQFLEKNGPIRTPNDLTKVPCLVDTNNRSKNNWRFQGPGGDIVSVAVHGRLEVNSPLATMRAAESGLGVALLPDFIAQEAISSGRLTPILTNWVPTDAGIYAIYPERRYLPAKVRTLVDFLSQWFKDNRTA
jgi:DNA-binding transcriptional LysR family regulator